MTDDYGKVLNFLNDTTLLLTALETNIDEVFHQVLSTQGEAVCDAYLKISSDLILTATKTLVDYYANRFNDVGK